MRRDLQDLGWGVALALLGVAVAAYSLAHYEFGTLRRMGPGFFPTVLGGVLGVLGAAIALPALRPRELPAPAPLFWREALTVAGALALFGILLHPAGIVLTTLLTAFLASLVAPRPGVVWRVVLALAVTAITWLVFIAALRMTIPVWPWSR